MREVAGDFMKISRNVIAYIKMFAEFSEKETSEMKPPIKEVFPKWGDAIWFVDEDEKTLTLYTMMHFSGDFMYVRTKTNFVRAYPRKLYGKLFFLDKNKAFETLKTLIGGN
jgi:hypothetical protein